MLELHLIVISCLLGALIYILSGPFIVKYPKGFILSRFKTNRRVLGQINSIHFIQNAAFASICIVFSFFIVWAFFGHLVVYKLPLEALTFSLVIISSILISLNPIEDIKRLYEFLRSCISIAEDDLQDADLNKLKKEYQKGSEADVSVTELINSMKSKVIVGSNSYVDIFDRKYKSSSPSLDDPNFISKVGDRSVNLLQKGRLPWSNLSTSVVIFACVVPLCLFAICFSRIESGMLAGDVPIKNSKLAFESSYAFLKDIYKISELSPCIQNTLSPSCIVEKFRPMEEGNPFLFLMAFFALFSIFFVNIRFLLSLYQKKLLLRAETSSGLGLEIDAVSKIGGFVAFFLAGLITLLMLKVELGQLGLLTGLVAAGMTVALRETLGNLMAGMQLIWDRSLKKGDVVSIPAAASNDTGSTYGIVQQIKMRYTVIQDRNTVRRLIPNTLLTSNPIESWTQEDNRVRLSMRISVNYNSEPRHVQKVMESVCYDVKRILISKPPQALLVAFDDSAITFSLRFWLEDTSTGIRPVVSEILINLLERFKDEGINIPYPQRTVHVDMIGKDGKNFPIFDNMSIDASKLNISTKKNSSPKKKK